jgi:hypothetical protein
MHIGNYTNHMSFFICLITEQCEHDSKSLLFVQVLVGDNCSYDYYGDSDLETL